MVELTIYCYIMLITNGKIDLSKTKLYKALSKAGDKSFDGFERRDYLCYSIKVDVFFVYKIR